MGNKKSKPHQKKSSVVKLPESGAQKQRGRGVQGRENKHEANPRWDNDYRLRVNLPMNSESHAFGGYNKKQSVPNPIEERNMKDVAKLVKAIQPQNYENFCNLLKTNPFIQHWKVFEEAVHVDLSFNLTNIQGTAISERPRLFTLRLMDQGYQITERELDRMEMRILLKRRFRVLKNCIIERYLMGLKSLQELCRQSFKKAHLNDNYEQIVKSLIYPEKLKDFLLKVS